MFSEDDKLKERDSLMAQILNIATGDLHATLPSLLSLTLPASSSSSSTSASQTIPALGTDSFSPSPTGALYLLASKAATSLLNDTASPFSLTLIPDHRNILALFIGSPDIASLTLPSVSHLPASLIDAVLILGWLAHRDAPYTGPNKETMAPTGSISDLSLADPHVDQNSMGQDDSFNTYLQCLTLVAATHPSPKLRNAAHDFAGVVLAGHKDPAARLDFLKDTLEHCPYENIKASAVGWVKGELVNGDGVFGKRETLQELGPLLFPEVDLGVEEDRAVQELLMNVPFYLAGLNLIYLLCESESLRNRLEVGRWVAEDAVETQFIDPLGKFVSVVLSAVPREEALEVTLLDDNILRARTCLNKVKKP